MPDASENKSFVLNFQTTIPRPRKDEDQNFLYSVIFIFVHIFLEQVKKEGEEKPTPKQTTSWSKYREFQESSRSGEWDRMSAVATTELVWIDSESNLSERTPNCQGERGVQGLGDLGKPTGILSQVLNS